MKDLYKEIFRRKSFRSYPNKLEIDENLESKIFFKANSLSTFDSTIKTKVYITKLINSKKNDYVLHFYSEIKPNYRLNAGFMLEEFVLYLTSLNVGTLFVGSKQDKTHKNETLKYILTVNFSLVSSDSFRLPTDNISRKDRNLFIKGFIEEEVINAVRYSASAVNKQPWLFEGITTGDTYQIICYVDKDNSFLGFKLDGCFDVGIAIYNILVTLNYLGKKYSLTVESKDLKYGNFQEVARITYL
ncbi:MAG: hypothetical protein LBV58_01305 [Acholeplasmatales bacterium]|jgi:hypothetical protein|nr:hypothetical protein [Acholeplasmatales bacterium]